MAELLTTDGRATAATERRRAWRAAARAARRAVAGQPASCSTPGRPGSPQYRDAELRPRRRCRARRCPRVALPRFTDDGELLRCLRAENLPGQFPFTAGVFPFKREGEDPARMFAGEGDAFRTNRRFHLLSEGQPATRLSTAFDSVTLYGCDPDERPDIYGKVGTSGVSIATLDDMKALYDGFDLCDPTTSVSMTINGPAPTILAMFLNTAIDEQLARRRGRDGPAADAAEAGEIRARTLRQVRGTVQADILKEDQGQNTCIFSTEFSLRMMADIAGVVHRQPGAQLLLGVDLRLPHRRGRRQPDQPAGLHPGQRLHLRRGLPGPRHGRSTTSRPTSRSSSPTAWTPSTP